MTSQNMTFGLALTNQSKRNIALFPPQTSTWLMRFLFRSSGRKVISDACRTNTFDQWRDKISLDVYVSALKYRLFFVRFYVTFKSFSSYMLLTIYVELMWKKQLLSSFLHMRFTRRARFTVKVFNLEIDTTLLVKLLKEKGHSRDVTCIVFKLKWVIKRQLTAALMRNE